MQVIGKKLKRIKTEKEKAILKWKIMNELVKNRHSMFMKIHAKEELLLDSGATNHICNNIDIF